MTQPQYEKSAGWAEHKSDYDKIMKLHGQGVEPKFIAERIGVSRSTVQKVIRELCGKMGRVV
jgi:DNA-binding NarL/FixJ family response regulator